MSTTPTQAPTKTVESYFGPKQVTREEFIKQWAEHFTQFYHLTGSMAEMNELNTMQTHIMTLAGRKWDSLK